MPDFSKEIVTGSEEPSETAESAAEETIVEDEAEESPEAS